MLFSKPIYGGTHHFFEHILPAMGIKTLGFYADECPEQFLSRYNLKPNELKLIFIETPANPTNALVDIRLWRQTIPSINAKLVVDNTLLGPLWQHPLQVGADLVLYSATKFLGGHSDVIAGSISGSLEDIHALKTYRTFLGNMLSPFECWLLMRSLETLEVRMKRQSETAGKVAKFLLHHPMIKQLYFWSDSLEVDRIFQQQCNNAGSILSFELYGGEKGAFTFLNALKIIKLAVSLGSTESLAQHPFTMTHAAIPDHEKTIMQITPGLVRLSIGLEHEEDLISDLAQALECITSANNIPSLQSILD